MATRKQFRGNVEANPALEALMSDKREATEAELAEQRVSFAYGNAMNSEGITKDSVRRSTDGVKLRA